jgi:hypothetical protein
MPFTSSLPRPLLIAALCAAVCSPRGGIAASQEDTLSVSEEFSEAIEDNSFFIEEAFNQEAGVVQHIQGGVYFSRPRKDFVYGFTQEWPLGSQAHQLSFTLPYAVLEGEIPPGGEAGGTGIGDILINYRYQLCTSGDWAAVSPRLSLILPTGREKKGLGSGVVGCQVNLPVSKRLSDPFIVHINGGATILPGVKGMTSMGREVKHTLSSFTIGASAIWLADQHINLMVEWVTDFLSETGAEGDLVRSTESKVSPGFRAAVDAGRLQIVPGFAVPFSFSGGESRVGMFAYLSFEHPF